MGGAHTGRAVTIWEGRVVPGEGPSTNEEGPTCLHVKKQLCGELPAVQWTCRGTGGGPGVSTGPGRAPATEDRPAGRAGKAACRGAARARPQGGTASEPRGGEDVLPVTGCGREVTKPLRERRAPAGTGLPLRRCPGRWVRRRFTETRAGLRAARRPELGGSGRPGSRWAGRRALGAGPPEGAGGTGLDRSRRREDSASCSCRHLPPELPVAAWTGGLPDSPAASGRPDFHHTAGQGGRQRPSRADEQLIPRPCSAQHMQLCSAHVDITPRPTAQAGNPQAQPHALLGPESRALAAHVCVTRVHRKGLRVAPASQPLRDPGAGRSHLCPSTKRMGPEMPSGPFPDVTPDECAPAAWHPSSRALRHCALPGWAGDLAWRRAWGQVPATCPPFASCLSAQSPHSAQGPGAATRARACQAPTPVQILLLFDSHPGGGGRGRREALRGPGLHRQTVGGHGPALPLLPLCPRSRALWPSLPWGPVPQLLSVT